MKPFVVGFSFVAAMAVLVWAGWMSASIPVVKVRELQATTAAGTVKLDTAKLNTVQVNDGKVVFIEALAPLRFKLSPRDDPSLYVWVEYPGSVPENFKEGRDVGLLGGYDPQKNLFTAERITTQCPSKYEASKEAKSEKPGGDYPVSAQSSLQSAPQAPSTAKPAAIQ